MLIELFWQFFQVGLFSFGGGMVAVTLLMEKLVTECGWLTAAAFNDLIAIAESTPGPIAVNAATFVGLQLGGIPGALVATFACILPGCAIVMLLSLLYQRYQKLTIVQGIMEGLRPVIIAMIFVGGFSILTHALFQQGMMQPEHRIDWLSAALFCICLYLNQCKKVSAVTLILGSGAVGAVIRLLTGN